MKQVQWPQTQSVGPSYSHDVYTCLDIIGHNDRCLISQRLISCSHISRKNAHWVAYLSIHRWRLQVATQAQVPSSLSMWIRPLSHYHYPITRYRNPAFLQAVDCQHPSVPPTRSIENRKRRKLPWRSFITHIRDNSLYPTKYATMAAARLRALWDHPAGLKTGTLLFAPPPLPREPDRYVQLLPQMWECVMCVFCVICIICHTISMFISTNRLK